MFSHNGKISARQVMIMLVIQMFNIGILILPRLCTEYTGKDGYLLPALAIPIGIIYLFCITRLTMQFENETIDEIAQKVLTQRIGNCLIGLFLIKSIMDLSISLRMFGEMISQVMLSNTPVEVITLVMLLAAAYMAKSGIEAVARMGEVLAYFIFIPLIIILMLMSIKVDYSEVLPAFQSTMPDVIQGTWITSLCFIPLEAILIINGLMRKPDKILKAGSIAIIAVGILASIITLFTICKIGINETQKQIWPVVTLMRSIGSQNAVVEKQEILMIIIWIFTFYAYVSMGLCIDSILLSKTLKYKRENIFVLPFIVIIYFMAIRPMSLSDMYISYLKLRNYYGIWFLVPIPVMLLVIAKIRRVGDEK